MGLLLYILIYFDIFKIVILAASERIFMPIKVEHRPDQLLQRSIQEELPEDLRGTYAEETTIPHHIMALNFLNSVIVGREFKNEAALKEVLSSWPQFAEENGLEVDSGWESIYILWEKKCIAFEGSLGGPFIIGLIQELNDLTEKQDEQTEKKQ
jgi:hypothetical protein